jgi:hypothetical protein
VNVQSFSDYAMKTNFSSSPPEFATILQAEIIENGEALAVLVQERNGTVSAVRISVGQLAD